VYGLLSDRRALACFTSLNGKHENLASTLAAAQQAGESMIVQRIEVPNKHNASFDP
jgi:hypothetical protein